MQIAIRRVRVCLLLPWLAACTLALPGGTANKPTPLAAEQIAVTTLDAAAKDQPAPKSPTTSPPPEAAPPEPPTPEPTPEPEPADAKTADPAPVDAAPEPAPPSPTALACTKKGGRYVKTGKGDLRACVKVTGDGGKQCRRESDCEGSCLARSGTCAPVTPLFGCNDILQDDGRRVSLCLN
jgi:hypothetical protein